jgi:DNA polymerase III gamma/tau subunit
VIFDLAQAIGEGDVKEALGRADKIVTGGLSTDTMIASLVDHLRNLLVLRTCGAESKLVEVPGLAMKDLQQQASQFDPIVLSQDITILEELRRQMRTSQAGRALLDATLVRLALAEQFSQIGELLSGNGAAKSAASGGAVKKKYVEAVMPSPSPLQGEGRGDGRSAPSQENIVSTDNVSPLTPTLSPQGEREQEDEDDALPAVGKVWDNSGPSLSELLKQHQAQEPEPAAQPAPVASAPTVSNIEPVNVHDLPHVWQKLLDVLAARGPALHSLVSHGKLTAIEDGRAVISYDRKHQTFVKLLDRNGKKDVVREALSQVAGQPLGVRFDVDDSGSDDTAATPASSSATAVMEAPPARPAVTPAARREPVRVAVEAPQRVAPPPNVIRITPELKESLRNSEPLIKAIMDELGADIVKVEPAETASN